MIALMVGFWACGTKVSLPSVEQNPTPSNTVDRPTAEDCFSDCMQARQMEARAIEAIEADCKRLCDPDEPKSVLEAPESQ